MNGAPRTERMGDAEAVRLVLAAQQYETMALDLLPPGSDQSRGLRVEAARKVATGEAARLFARADALYWRIILAHDAFVRRVARFNPHDMRRGVEEEDIYQTARAAAHRGLIRYEPGRGMTVRSWVARWVKVGLQRSADRAGDIHTPSNFSCGQRVWSTGRLDAPIDAGDRDAPRFVDRLSAETVDPVDALTEARNHARYTAALAAMPFRDAEILRRCLAGESLTDIGPHVGVSRERVRQIRERAIRRVCTHIYGDDAPIPAAVVALRWVP